MDRAARRLSAPGFESDQISSLAGFGGSRNTPIPTPALDSNVDLTKDEKPQTRTHYVWRQLHGGWRTGIALGALAAIIVLSINVGLLIWVRSAFDVPHDGAATVFRGSCTKKTTISIWCHLAINVCSTLLLSASNHAMRVLSAPTREDIDKAHCTGLRMDIGVSSIKNLRSIPKRRTMIWVALGISSIPLHLL